MKGTIIIRYIYTILKMLKAISKSLNQFRNRLILKTHLTYIFICMIVCVSEVIHSIWLAQLMCLNCLCVVILNIGGCRVTVTWWRCYRNITTSVLFSKTLFTIGIIIYNCNFIILNATIRIYLNSMGSLKQWVIL